MVAEPVPNLIDLDRLDEPLERIIERAAEARERIVLKRGGVVLALVVPANEREPVATPARERFRAVAAEASRRFADVPAAELEARIAEAVEEVRLESWRERQSSE